MTKKTKVVIIGRNMVVSKASLIAYLSVMPELEIVVLDDLDNIDPDTEEWLEETIDIVSGNLEIAKWPPEKDFLDVKPQRVKKEHKNPATPIKSRGKGKMKYNEGFSRR